MKRAIEESFPIVEINRLAIPELSAFKPIYQMHKWFAPRASCIFRAILLGALKPAGTDIMGEFYSDHNDDSETNGRKIIDPFMGRGTTVVEAMRLGCEVTGIDLNPVAWFVVNISTNPRDVGELDVAFERLAERAVPWSGKSVRETLLDLYRTSPPWIRGGDAEKQPASSDLIYTFWVKSAPCSNPVCRKLVPLFKDYLVAAKSPSIRYHPDCACPKCAKTFDWEIEPAALTADPNLMLHAARNSGGVGRSSARWTYAHPGGGLYVAQGKTGGTQSKVEFGDLEKGKVCCPHCYEIVVPALSAPKLKRKKVPLSVLLCPKSEQVFQWRGELPDEGGVTSPAGHAFGPREGNIPKNGRYTCSHCGNQDAIIAAIRSLPEDQLLPMHAYAVQAYAPDCDRGFGAEGESEDDLFAQHAGKSASAECVPPTDNLIWKAGAKYFSGFQPADRARFEDAQTRWKAHKGTLPHPKSKVPVGEKTKSGLIAHHYRYWHQMFNERQLLALATLLEGIMEIDLETTDRDLLLAALSNTLEANNVFTRGIASRTTPGGTAPAGVFARHDFQPKMTICEQNVWGTVSGNNTFLNRMAALRKGLAYASEPYDGAFDDDGKHSKRINNDTVRSGTRPRLILGDSRSAINDHEGAYDAVITDPPYSDNVNYSELADFFYVWLRLALKDRYPEFLPEYCSKAEEIIENKTRNLSARDFEDGLTEVFAKSAKRLTDDGIFVFTFHHAEGKAWEAVLNSICNAGLFIEAVYPIHSEREASLHLQDKTAIAYDLIHVCRKRDASVAATRSRTWAGLRQEVRKRARKEIEAIEAGRYGGEPLPAPDVRMVLIGKCLEVYSRHYGQVLDWRGVPLPLGAALQDIRLMVEQVVSHENPLPSELDKIDATSQVWLLAFCDKTEVSYDNVSKLTRGVFETSELTAHKPPLIRKGRLKGGRTYRVLTPQERLNDLKERFNLRRPSAQMELLSAEESGAVVPGADNLIDDAPFLLAQAELGERLDQWVENFHGLREPLRATFEYLNERDPKRWKIACDRLLPFYTGTMLAGMAPAGGATPARSTGKD